MKPIIFIICCLGLAAGLGFVGLNSAASETDEQFAEKANLALRQVGHQLLLLVGDERSAIPPVRRAGPSAFILELQASFNYDTLPQLLHQAFRSYDMHREYQVAVKRCHDGIPILGYNQSAFERGEVPCIGREQKAGCSNIVLTFAAPDGSSAGLPWRWIALLVLYLLAMVGMGLYWKQNNNSAGSPTASDPTLSLGNFTFDPQNQTLQLDEQQQQLTFRESKLLYVLACNANEVITRDTLADEVWGDEGVIVGRSLDVFISRLRKLLKGDSAVSIKSIHGVGYRLEAPEA